MLVYVRMYVSMHALRTYKHIHTRIVREAEEACLVEFPVP